MEVFRRYLFPRLNGKELAAHWHCSKNLQVNERINSLREYTHKEMALSSKEPDFHASNSKKEDVKHVQQAIRAWRERW
jgi:hypothetical protein